MTDSYLYDSFGNILLTSGSTTNWFRYVGRLGYYYDLNLIQYYVRRRFMDPTAARFTKRDDLLFGTGQSNQYYYVNNNPSTLIDSSGQVIVPPWFQPAEPDARYGPGFKLCQRDILGSDIWTWSSNQAGGAILTYSWVQWTRRATHCQAQRELDGPVRPP